MTVLPPASLFFRQLFDRTSCTFTYLLADLESRSAVIIDPVDTLIERDLKLISENRLNLTHALNTHVHADHVTGTGLIKQRLPDVITVIGSASNAKADLLVQHGDVIPFSSKYTLSVIHTPGHTKGCVSYHIEKNESHPGLVFTGDALFVRGCGRTDFQGGDSHMLFRSVRERLFTLPHETIVYPAHDYRGMTSSTVAEEIEFNPRLGKTNTLEDFQHIMANLNLAYPKMMDVAMPINMHCGVPPRAE